MDSELGLQGPAVLIEQHIRQPHRHSLTDNTISASPWLHVPLPALPTSKLLMLFSLLRVLFGGGPSPARCCHWQSAVAKARGSLRRHKPSCLIPLPLCEGVNPGPAIPISQGICAKLEGGLGVPAFRIGLGLAAELEMKT